MAEPSDDALAWAREFRLCFDEQSSAIFDECDLSLMEECAATAIDAAEHAAAWEDFEFVFREIAMQPDDTLTAEAQATKAKMREIVKPLIDAAVKSALEEATWDSQPQA